MTVKLITCVNNVHFHQQMKVYLIVYSSIKVYMLEIAAQHVLFVCLFDLGLMSLSTIFQSYSDDVWIWQGAQCSLLECCLTEMSRLRHFDVILHPVTLY